MALQIFQALLLALALCADCFAVSASSSVSLSDRRFSSILPVALAFAFIQTAFFGAGVLFGDLLSSHVMGAAHLIGFLLLLYVGGSMLLEAFKKKEPGEGMNLNGPRNVLVGGVATSIDALSVGASLSIDGIPLGEAVMDSTAVFLVTALTVILGILGGSSVGKRFGRPALISGGVVLVLIGLNILLGIF